MAMIMLLMHVRSEAMVLRPQSHEAFLGPLTNPKFWALKANRLITDHFFKDMFEVFERNGGWRIVSQKTVTLSIKCYESKYVSNLQVQSPMG